MFRFSVIASVLLIFGIAAKPWNKLENEAFEEKFVSIDERGKLSWDVEVDPQEDMDGIHDEIDPDMKIWKRMKALKAEEDLDELHHPSTADLHVQIQNTDLDVDVLPKSSKSDANGKDRQEAEEDRDETDHPSFTEVVGEEPEMDEDYNKARKELAKYLAPLVSGYKAEVADAPYQPEENEDQQSFVEAMRSERAVRIHLQPEEDFDDLYHKDVSVQVVHRDDSRVAAPVDFPSYRKYSEPEEDLDDLYHR